uniref:histidine kinase n=1 Tax=Ignavibacterium album TaxID=591197 RepID=A0A832G878_9BACT
MLSKEEEKLIRENEELKQRLEQYKSAIYELQILNEIAIAAGNSQSTDQTLNTIVQKILRALNTEQGSIMLLTEDKNDPFKTFLHKEDFSTLKPHYRLNTSISGWVLKNEEPLLIKNLSDDNRFYPTEEERREIKSILCTPIWFEGKIIGVMTLINKKDKTEFTENDLSLLSILAIQVGQLIKNSQLQQEYFQKTKEAELSRWETERLKELDTVKTNFFTNLSHEFRTPLTLILGPLERLLEGKGKGDPSSLYKLMHNHASRLLQLVNQLLDLSSIDAGKMKLEIVSSDVISFVKGIVSSFESFAEEKSIQLNFNSQKEKFECYFDKDKLQKIISNLLSNAVKFNKEGGFVNITVSEKRIKGISHLQIEVEDNGPGMSSEVQKNIFNRFYKSKGLSTVEGSGIGLALVKELVEIHFGEIEFKSTEGKGTTFKITIPVDEEFYEKKNIISSNTLISEDKTKSFVQNPEKRETSDDTSEETPLLLIVEDNDDMRQFIKENILQYYKVIEAIDGEDGLSKSTEHLPDLIISDVLMPKINGYELCEKIKTDERTSHIPVILLTSKAEVNGRIRGLETGADDYVTKPFNSTELLSRIKNLIDQRKKLREKFSKEITLEPKNVAVTSADEKFLTRALEIVEKNISNENFTAEDFAESIGMSKTHLNRKLNALTDTSANEFIRTYRLKKAARLLSSRSGNISEIAYEVGFSNPSYFAESFKKFFGCTPSEYQQQPDTSNP